jgi:hypothetical protein
MGGFDHTQSKGPANHALSCSTADRQDAHTQSEILFKGIGAQVGNLYMALFETFVSGTDEATACIMNRSGTTVVSGLISTDPRYQGHTNAIKDARLQEDLFHVWRHFSRFCETQLSQGSSYIVEKALQFEITCLAGQLIAYTSENTW